MINVIRCELSHVDPGALTKIVHAHPFFETYIEKLLKFFALQAATVTLCKTH